MRKVIARRLADVKFSAPEFYLTMEINMDKAVASRAKLNEIATNKISFNDMVLKACALALKKHPAINSSWQGDTIRVNHHVSIGVAVAVEEGLLVPVVRFADLKSLSQIAGEVKDYATRAKAKKLQPAEWEGNTFTISNLGMFGIEEFTAIINPPASCILAIGAINQVPVVKNGQIVDRQRHEGNTHLRPPRGRWCYRRRLPANPARFTGRAAHHARNNLCIQHTWKSPQYRWDFLFLSCPSPKMVKLGYGAGPHF